VWHDEAAVLLNVLGKDFADLLGPLYFAEAAPPLFLWLERASFLLLGDSTYALRLLPLLGSCAALVLLAWVARQVLSASAVPWAVLFLACSDRLLWHACEAKPYSFDALAAVVVSSLFCATRSWDLTRSLLAFSLLAPWILFLVYPGCFLCGGLLIAFLPAVLRSRRPLCWSAYVLFAVTVLVLFSLLLLGPIHAQRCEAMTQCWEHQFPPLDRPWRVPGWAFVSTLEVMDYCCRPVGGALFLVAIIGGVSLWRRGHHRLVVLLIVPVALALVAACLRAYPYGGTRVLVFAAPAVVLLLAEGIPPVLNWLRDRSRFAPAALMVLFLAPLALALERVAHPWSRTDCSGAAAYVLARHQPGDAVLANHWEYGYYFRHVEFGYHLPEQGKFTQVRRLWVVLSGQITPEERNELLHAMTPAGWHPTAKRGFVATTVTLLEPPAVSVSARTERRPPGDQGGDVTALEATVDVHDDDVGGAAVKHGQ
jgi:uncharacterized membrane protein